MRGMLFPFQPVEGFWPIGCLIVLCAIGDCYLAAEPKGIVGHCYLISLFGA